MGLVSSINCETKLQRQLRLEKEMDVSEMSKNDHAAFARERDRLLNEIENGVIN